MIWASTNQGRVFKFCRSLTLSRDTFFFIKLRLYREAIFVLRNLNLERTLPVSFCFEWNQFLIGWSINKTHGFKYQCMVTLKFGTNPAISNTNTTQVDYLESRIISSSPYSIKLCSNKIIKSFSFFNKSTVWQEPIWIKVKTLWQILLQHQRGPESPSIN